MASVSVVTPCDPVVPANYSLDRPPNAYFYEHVCDQRQRRLSVPAGTTLDWEKFKPFGLNDRITTVVVPPNTRAWMHKANCMAQGKSLGDCSGDKDHMWLSTGVYDLRNTPGGFNDVITEVAVQSVKPHREWLLDCCRGRVSPVSDCANFGNPQSGDCRQLMGEFCSNKDNFFSTECRQWAQNLNDSQRNEVARQVCPQATTQSEKEWCACFLSRDMPERHRGTQVESLWPCLDPVCNDSSRALQRFNSPCPTTLTICEQNDVVADFQTSEVGKFLVQNQCGNIELPPSPRPPPSTPDESVPPTSSWFGGTTTAKVGVGAILVIILIAVGIIIYGSSRARAAP